jgi:hypothetical protein
LDIGSLASPREGHITAVVVVVVVVVVAPVLSVPLEVPSPPPPWTVAAAAAAVVVVAADAAAVAASGTGTSAGFVATGTFHAGLVGGAAGTTIGVGFVGISADTVASPLLLILDLVLLVFLP